jgi:subtilase family serine protease
MAANLVFTDIYKQFIVSSPQINTLPNAKTFLQLFATPDVGTSSVTTFPPQYFSGTQLKSLYNIPTVTPTNSSTKKVTIAIIVAFTYPNLKADLKTYWQNSINFGPSSTPPVINIYTAPGATKNVAWAQEECLDVQMVCTMNPNANIWVVEAKSDAFTDLMSAISYATSTIKADVISMSWGLDEVSQLTAYNGIFTNTSVCYCAASGDANIVSWPATSLNCVAIGGTSLLWNPNFTPNRTEYAWNSSGCGYSTIIPQPNYQSAITSITHNNRVIPDISLIADTNTSVYSVYNGNWYGVGGTSVGTPMFSAILSLANQQRFNSGKGALTTVYSTTPNSATTLTYVPPANNLQNYIYKTIYPNATQYASAFYDVAIGQVVGSTGGNSNGKTTYSSGTKFDVTTGLGSPNATNLCNMLATL